MKRKQFTEEQIIGILKDAAAEAAERREPQDAHELAALAKGIRADTAV